MTIQINFVLPIIKLTKKTLKLTILCLAEKNFINLNNQSI